MNDQTLAAFVLFVRINSGVAATDPLIRRAFNAYQGLSDELERDHPRFVPGNVVLSEGVRGADLR